MNNFLDTRSQGIKRDGCAWHQPRATCFVLGVLMSLACSLPSWAAESSNSAAKFGANESEMAAAIPAFQAELKQFEDVRAQYELVRATYQKEIDKSPVFSVSGKVWTQEENALVVYGLAIGNIAPGQLGLVTKEAIIVVLWPNHKQVIGGVGGHFSDNLYYLGADRIGRPQYGPPSATLKQAQAKFTVAETTFRQAGATMAAYLSQVKTVLSQIQNEVTQRSELLENSLPSVPASLPDQAAALGYLNALNHAEEAWRAGMTERDANQAALAAHREQLFALWSATFSELAEPIKSIQLDEANYRKKCDAFTKTLSAPAIPYFSAAIQRLPAQVSTAEQLAVCGAGIPTIWSLAPAEHKNDLLKKVLNTYWSSLENSFASSPMWNSADEKQIANAIQSFQQHDPDGFKANRYTHLITIREDALGQRELATLKEPLATLNPWTETRHLGIEGEDRVYHRNLFLRYSASQTGTQIIDHFEAMQAEVSSNPSRWTNSAIRTSYVNLFHLQFKVWLDKIIKTSPAELVTADEKMFTHSMQLFEKNAPDGFKSDSYGPLIKTWENILGQRELATLKEPLATLNPWNETRLLGIEGEDRVYHRNLFLLYSASQTGAHIIDHFAAMQAEALSNPPRWANSAIRASYVSLFRKQFSRWFDKTIKSPPTQLIAELPVIDRLVAAPDEMLDAALSYENAGILLVAIDKAKHATAGPSLFKKSSLARLAEVRLTTRQRLYHGKLLIGTDRIGAPADILALDDFAEKTAQNNPENWPPEARGIWNDIISDLFYTYLIKEGESNSPSLYQRTNDALSQHDYRGENRFPEIQARWLNACRTITVAEAANMLSLSRKKHLQLRIRNDLGLYIYASVRCFDERLLTDLVTDIGQNTKAKATVDTSPVTPSATTPPPKPTTDDPLFGK